MMWATDTYAAEIYLDDAIKKKNEADVKTYLEYFLHPEQHFTCDKALYPSFVPKLQTCLSPGGC